MREVKVAVAGSEVIVAGDTWSQIHRKIAKRLGCKMGDVDFKQKQDKGGQPKTIHISTEEDWSYFANKGYWIHASTDKPGLKRKSTLTYDRNRAEPDSDLSSSYDTPLRPSASKRPRSSHGSNASTSKLNGSIPLASTSQQNAVVRSTKSSRKTWTPKEDTILWDHFKSLVASMPDPDPVYTVEQKTQLFDNISRQAFGGKRSVNAIQAQLAARIKTAARKGVLSSRHKAIFPMMVRGLVRSQKPDSTEIIIDDSDEGEEEDEDKDEDDDEDEGWRSLEGAGGLQVDTSSSSESEDTPPLTTDTALPARPASIRVYNPFAGPTAVPPRRIISSLSSRQDRVQRPEVQGATQNGNHPNHASMSTPNSIRSVSDYTSSRGRGLDGSLSVEKSTDRPPISSRASIPAGGSVTECTASPQRIPPTFTPLPSSSTRITAAPEARSPTQPLANQVGSLSLDKSAQQSTTLETGEKIGDAIIIKDESEDELLDDSPSNNNHTPVATTRVQPFRAGSVKKEHQETREAVRGSLDRLYPIQSILILPPVNWANSLAHWIKTNALSGVTEPILRVEILVACFDEFFFFSYRKINDNFSIQRATFGIALLFLDLYHAFQESEEVQTAIVDIFYDRIFSPQAPKPDVPQEWPRYDLCAAISTLFPLRPDWLITLILKRSDYFRIDQVPPPVEKVTLLFERLRTLLQKLSACHDFIEKKEPDLKLLYKSVHRSFIDGDTLDNLQAFHRQARLPPSERTAMTTILAEIAQINSEAAIRENRRQLEDEKFFTERLMLVSSLSLVEGSSIEKIAADLKLSIQVRNGPMKHKLLSTRETWHLWILQFSNKERKQDAIAKLRDRTPNQDVQFLEPIKQTHSMCPSKGQEEQKEWHRSRCDNHLHRDYHRQCIKRIKQEPA